MEGCSWLCLHRCTFVPKFATARLPFTAKAISWLNTLCIFRRKPKPQNSDLHKFRMSGTGFSRSKPPPVCTVKKKPSAAQFGTFPMTRLNIINDYQLFFTPQVPVFAVKKNRPRRSAGGKPGETFKNYRLDYIVSVPRCGSARRGRFDYSCFILPKRFLRPRFRS